LRGTLGSGLAGLAAVLLAGAISRAVLLAAGFALADTDGIVTWVPAIALAAAVAGAWLAVAVVDGVAGRVETRVAVGVVAALTLLALISAISGAGPDGRGAAWRCGSLVLAGAVIAWRFKVTDARRA
jgi:peptidoglycan/LPS O-acetylase OafA/YrhL